LKRLKGNVYHMVINSIHSIIFLRFYYYHWFNTSSCGLLFPEGYDRPS
jgi:hypothetical protein